MGIARDTSDIFYVSGGSSHDIVKFDTDGNDLGELTHPDLTGPQGVAFDDRGHLFSSSFYQDGVVEFDANGNYVQTITEGNLNVPRSIAFAPRSSVGDLDGDGQVRVPDLIILLAGWGPCPAEGDCPADLDGDNQVRVPDLIILLGNLG